ncbi:saccharopine dehydrogenase NADP-binding domain-containing protein [Oscillatoriales cyanobacterium LEGE 11467]|uniref:Saccharopine dehydrogenase NADP-binding domain-containing protein n=1 Tax=Zarconia navalis LEGE 11467 TaxID=1828826 RepID=A0A928VWL6_9CYAN|nr:saccharopine dehydrogenase NADP-binding domain-containing protein [Zarconia navalis]MBE9040889.1 saccharopine dehydrogenase NADP-binding domain-containing protein [Zarconia navalis LEGE 11467]
MNDRVLVIGGSGRIGDSVARDLADRTQAQITVTGRKNRANLFPYQYLQLDVSDRETLSEAISQSNLVIHCAGPFLDRDASVLETCIEQGVNYLDVSDSPAFVRKALTYRDAAKKAGITAILNSGIFPGISNSMVRQGIEQLDTAETVHLSYVVGGSGGAGVTIMRTTFLGLLEPFRAWIDGRWQTIQPYSDREIIEFPEPYGKVGVYWFDVPEILTLPESFPVKTAIAKFGSIPDYYNRLTWGVARFIPKKILKNPATIEFLSQASYRMTQMTDKQTGIGVAIRAKIEGTQAGKPTQVCLTLTHPDTAIAAGAGTGSIAQLMLNGQLQKSGVFPVEQALSTDLFEVAMSSRGMHIAQQLTTLESKE